MPSLEVNALTAQLRVGLTQRASNFWGRSIKRKLLHRKRPLHEVSGRELRASSLTDVDEDW